KEGPTYSRRYDVSSRNNGNTEQCDQDARNDCYETSRKSKPKRYDFTQRVHRKVKHWIVHQRRVLREVDRAQQYARRDDHGKNKAESGNHCDHSNGDADHFGEWPEYSGNAVKDESDQAEREQEYLREHAFFTLLDVQPFLNIGFKIRKGNRLPLHLHSIGDRMCLRKDYPKYNVDQQA